MEYPLVSLFSTNFADFKGKAMDFLACKTANLGLDLHISGKFTKIILIYLTVRCRSSTPSPHFAIVIMSDCARRGTLALVARFIRTLGLACNVPFPSLNT
jgi:hypothetical protein